MRTFPRGRSAVTAAFGKLARLRRARVLHPRGVLFDAELTTLVPGPLPLPAGTSPVTVRLSKGAGTPDGVPDVLGVAVRIPTASGPWDLTFSSAGRSRLGRVLPRPAASWYRAYFSSVVPYRVRGRLMWLVADANGDDPGYGASLAAATRFAERGRLRIHLAGLSGFPQELALLRLRAPQGDADQPRFDPMIHCPPGTHLVPGWLAGLRELAYRGSRQGRSGQ